MNAHTPQFDSKPCQSLRGCCSRAAPVIAKVVTVKHMIALWLQRGAKPLQFFNSR
jgi:hypothetical protein